MFVKNEQAETKQPKNISYYHITGVARLFCFRAKLKSKIVLLAAKRSSNFWGLIFLIFEPK